jgi:hypothetical protein
MTWYTSLQICIKCGAREAFVQGSKYGYATQIPNLTVSAEFSLTLSQVGKGITSGILGVSLYMSIRA